MPKRNRLWTVSDEELLRKMVAAGEPVASIATALERSETAVFVRGALLNLKMSRDGRRRRF